jgi:uncharacterized protein YwgA
MARNVVGPQELVTLAISAANGVVTPVQLQKSVFLICKADLPEVPEDAYNFTPYHFGPFDAHIYSDADELHEEGLVLSAPSLRGRWVDRMITPAGMKRAEELKADLSNATVKRIQEIADEVQSLSFSDLLRKVYAEYPEYKENSVFVS